MSVPYHYIQSIPELTPFLPAIRKNSTFAVDTEFVRERTLNARFGLLQLFDGDNLLLIEPDVALATREIWQMLINPAQLKVLHAANEDLELFLSVNGIRLNNVIDTQIAAAFLGLGNALGFGALVAQQLEVELDKSHARTDWIKRPLTELQLNYAAADVRYLLPLFHNLHQQLEDKGLLKYCMAESQRIADSKKLPDTNSAYLGVKNAWQLNSRQLASLKILAAWRLEMARKKDLALNFEVNDLALVGIAKKMPRNIDSLKAIADVKPHELRRYAKTFLALVNEASEINESDYPETIIRIVDLPDYKQKQRQLSKTIEAVAQDNNIPQPVLASKKQIGQFLIWQYQQQHDMLAATQPVLIQGWRNELLKLKD